MREWTCSFTTARQMTPALITHSSLKSTDLIQMQRDWTKFSLCRSPIFLIFSSLSSHVSIFYKFPEVYDFVHPRAITTKTTKSMCSLHCVCYNHFEKPNWILKPKKKNMNLYHRSTNCLKKNYTQVHKVYLNK